VELVFRSALRASPARVWEWMTSVDGIAAELWPFFRMTMPPGVRSLTDVASSAASGVPIRWQPGKLLFRSHVFLFGILPIDRSDLTLLELTPGTGFVEESPMLSMRLWRHERWLTPTADGAGVILTDRLTFAPRWATPLVAWFIARTFTHRHAVLRRAFDGVPANDGRAST
jgi:ligand-binding SRPBCC domain-containing protein